MVGRVMVLSPGGQLQILEWNGRQSFMVIANIDTSVEGERVCG